MEDKIIIYLILTFIGGISLGLFIGVIIGRAITLKWSDKQVQKHFLLFVKILMTTIITILLTALTVRKIITPEFQIDDQFYWVFALLGGSIMGFDLSNLRLLKTIQDNIRRKQPLT